jgi:outer membrane protein TolC
MSKSCVRISRLEISTILVNSTRRKAGFNLSTPGELPRLEAEYEAAEQRVKKSSATYLESLDKLRSMLQVAPNTPLAIEIPPELPPVPQLAPKSVEDLRSMQASKIDLENARKNRLSIRSKNSAKFDLVGRARTTGQDRDPAASQAKMNSGEYPDYYVGIEFSSPIDGNAFRGERADVEIKVQEAEANLQVNRDKVRDDLASLERTVASQFVITKSAMDTVDYRARVVQQLETAYRQGRQPLVELIRAYNDLFTSQLDRARAIGEYHTLLNRLAASRDELFTTSNK